MTTIKKIDILNLCYKKILNRQPDEEGIETYSKLLSKNVSANRICNALMESVEYKTLKAQRNNDIVTAGILSLYNFTPGGGENFLLNICKGLEMICDKIYFFLNDESIPLFESTINTLGIKINLSKISVINCNLYEQYSIDYFIFMGNEKYPERPNIGTKLGIFHCQFPFDEKREPDVRTKKNTMGYQYILLNSNFTKHWYSSYVHKSLKLNPIVLNPSIPYKKDLHLNGKENYVVMLGRFFEQGHCKNQHVFLKYTNHIIEKGFKIILIGSVSDKDYFSKHILPYTEHIEIYLNINNKIKNDILKKAKFLISLTGFEHKCSPKHQEHFGISVIEAMSYGCVPICYNNGGPKESVIHNRTGYLFDTIEEMLEYITDDAFEQVNKMNFNLYHLKYYNKLFQLFTKWMILNPSGTSQLIEYYYKTYNNLYSKKYVLEKTNDFKKAFVYIEFQENPFVFYTLQHNLQYFPNDWGLIFVCIESNKAYIQHCLQNVENYRLVVLPYEKTTIFDYSRILTSDLFWNKLISFDIVCIIQSDVILLNSNIDSFCDYDYIGAPWTNESSYINNSIGNGGFSLRRPSVMLKIIKKYPYIFWNHFQTEDYLNEDIYFCSYLPLVSNNIPPPDIAKQFSVETLFYNKPVGIHKAWLYNDTKQMKEIFCL